MGYICPHCEDAGIGFEQVVKRGVLTHMKKCRGTKHFACGFLFHPADSYLYCEKIVRTGKYAFSR